MCALHRSQWPWGEWKVGCGEGARLGAKPSQGSLHNTGGWHWGARNRRRTTDGAGGSERRNKKQLRPFLNTLCVFALLQVTLVKSLERKSQRIQQSILQPMKACFSKE